MKESLNSYAALRQLKLMETRSFAQCFELQFESRMITPLRLDPLFRIAVGPPNADRPENRGVVGQPTGVPIDRVFDDAGSVMHEGEGAFGEGGEDPVYLVEGAVSNAYMGWHRALDLCKGIKNLLPSLLHGTVSKSTVWPMRLRGPRRQRGIQFNGPISRSR